MSQLQLRPYQNECIEAIEKCEKEGKKRQLVALPTGSGKTLIFSYLIHKRKQNALILVASTELLYQTRDKLKQFDKDADIGLVDQNHKEFDRRIVVSTIQSASIPANRQKLKEQRFELIITDECHHAAAPSYKTILEALGCFSDNGPLLVGFTATPFRNDKKGLGQVFEVVSYEKNTKNLIELGYLCPPQGFQVVTDIDFSTIDTEHEPTLSKIMNTQPMREQTVSKWKEIASGKRTIGFCVNVEHARDLAAEFNKQGITAKALWGTMPLQERKQALQDFKDGKITVLCNCNLLAEGYDAPFIECIIIARPTKSKGRYQQMIGRGLRPYLNKRSCIVIDFSDKSHSICNAAQLLDGDEDEQGADHVKDKKQRQPQIPYNLDPELKSVLLGLDLLKNEFNWQSEGTTHVMSGINNCVLQVHRDGKGYSAWFRSPRETKLLADKVGFEYAFGAAQDFARENRKLFVLCDTKAAWWNDPVSDNQLALLRSFGFKSGINKLTKGQASIIIGSGIKKKNPSRRT